MRIRLLLLFCLLATFSFAQEREVKLKLVQVSDIHGNFFPYDFIARKEMGGGLSRVHAYLTEVRDKYDDRLLFVDNGDLMQGQPSAYYYNFIDTLQTNLAIDILNYMGCTAATMGNHDIETGLPVFSRAITQAKFPVLGANIVNVQTGEVDSRFRPYTIIERDGVRIAILGLMTPGIPAWLPEKLWQGLRFDDMEQTARKWLPIIRETEHPHLIIGLFHSGAKGQLLSSKFNENASIEVAQRVPGFDAVLMGHDHLRANYHVTNVVGDSVFMMNPASNGVLVSDIDISVRLNADGKLLSKKLSGRLVNTDSYTPNKEFMEHFEPQYKEVKKFMGKKIGELDNTISTRSSYFGSSAFVDLIHTLQLAITHADISLAAPLSFDAQIEKGDICVSDMFKLYKYENMLYTMSLTGREIKDALEYSYALWSNQMRSKDDHLLLFRADCPDAGSERTLLQNASFNFDSAAGIIYTVDVSKPAGQKITIHSFADGKPFSLSEWYRVAVNSYRGNGGGSILTEGAGISQDQLPGRVITSTDKDLRYYLMRYIEQMQQIQPRAMQHWKFIPEEWVKAAAERDYKLLFNK